MPAVKITFHKNILAIGRRRKLNISVMNSAQSVLTRAERRSEKKLSGAFLTLSNGRARLTSLLPRPFDKQAAAGLAPEQLVPPSSPAVMSGVHLHDLIKTVQNSPFWWNSNLVSVPSLLILSAKFDPTDPSVLELLPWASLAQYSFGSAAPPLTSHLLFLLYHNEG